MERFREQKILLQTLNANFFGQKLKGFKQIRGNGALILTEKRIWFLLGIPKREISIPMKNINTVSLTKIFLGKKVFQLLLCIEYLPPQGGIDAIALAVNNPEKWKDAIEQAKRKSSVQVIICQYLAICKALHY